MKIYVRSRTQMRNLVKTNPGIFKNKNNYFISITESGSQPNTFPAELLDDHFLCMVFDDISEEIYKENPYLIVFTKEHAEKILDFISKIDKDKCGTIYINCAAGISRSGAVGEILNRYFNLDENEFRKNNSQIIPNVTVKRILEETLFGPTDYSEIFK